ncbi:hypothetical protein COL23_25705 [Priestia aryabhattai]|uniref:hypothetical protein n=1 Tax=Priestia aryabhattai TaxID=412384 RepID=UPI000BF67903|nr:hypothetical protein [Priestia aryabhattai]PFW72149.1 hypothetical protein COL23_25705 [Priestia aryabhattai]
MLPHKYSLDGYEVKKIIEDKINENPDIFYYIDNPYLQKVIDALVDGVSEAMAQNNKKLVENIMTIVEDETRKRNRSMGIHM